MKASLALKDEFDKNKKENELVSKDILKLKNSMSKFYKRKGTLDNFLDS